jgi:molybdopterin-synthase adenylyltransferase
MVQGAVPPPTIGNPMNNPIWLLPTVRVARIDEQTIELFSSDGGVRIEKIGERVLQLIALLDGTRTEAELSEAPGFATILQFLDARGWLVRLDDSLDRIEASAPARTRQLSYYAHLRRQTPDQAFVQLARSCVLIVGVGGVGTHAALVLAGGGVRRFVLNDHDTIDSSNLNRQIMFTRDDRGRSKAETLRERLLQRFDDLEVEVDTVNHDYDASDSLPDVDLILLCGESRRFHERPARIGVTPLLPAGYFGGVGAVGPLISPRHGTPCWRCIVEHTGRADYERVEANEVARPRGWNSSGSGINTIMGGMLGEAALRFLAPALGNPVLLGRRLQLDLSTFGTSYVDVPIAHCPHSARRSETVA